ncbi:threonine/serine exporter family protein [Amphibacillus sediminis]|uniref:threonine/serine exporter family protein n=1 Tax=Amphibacillus sediminis TaxID=360185 RepID=UPI0008305573|nr:threonine/serine exporter family protein [Amphibacillus sediminis]
MLIFEQLLVSFIAAAGFAIIFNTPRQVLWPCGLVGMCGWFVYTLLGLANVDAVVATLIASIIVAVISQLFAKWFRTPILIFNVAGIIPFVPGGLAYDAMRQFVENNYDMAIQLAARVVLLSGAIALGLVFSEIINQMIRRAKWKRINDRLIKD